MTTTKAPEQEANELVEMFKSNRVEIFTRMDSIPCVLSDFLTTKSARGLAILHVERLIEVLSCYTCMYEQEAFDDYKF